VAWIAGLVGTGLFLPVNAQPVTPASAASAPAKDAATSERVQHEASDVFRWIKLHADKPRKAAETKPASKSDATAASTDNSARAPAKGDKLAKAALATARVAPVTPSAPPVDLAVEKPTESTPLEVASATVASVPVVELAMPKPVEVEKPLKPISQPEPEFPADLMATLGKGSVKLRFLVQADGTVSEPEVLFSSHRRLNSPALAAVALWRFEPILTPRRALIELGFNLD
jgi:TonB family protein